LRVVKNAIIIRSLTDLRARPQFRSERKSQLLFGEPVSVGVARGGYCRVSQPDGYSGWVDRKALLFLSGRKAAEYRRSLDYQIVSKAAGITGSGDDNFVYPPFLCYGTRLPVKRTKGNRAVVILPDNRRFLILRRAIMPISELKRLAARSSYVISQARKFLGTPYLWGGLSPFGFDCSGLIQTIFRTVGVDLPRDSKEQRKIGMKVPRENIRGGDLLFFTGHVALAFDRCRIIHSSLAEGGVAVNSLKPGDRRFREDLYESFIEARRVLP
jgi:hypothetical protein